MVARSPVILMKCSRWSAACFFVAFDHLVLRLLVCIVVYIQAIMAAVLTNVAIWEKLNTECPDYSKMHLYQRPFCPMHSHCMKFIVRCN